MGRGVNQLKDKIKELNKGYKPTSLAEIGSQDGNDAVDIANYWNISHENVYIFEAHPGFYERIKKNKSEYNVYHYAITDSYDETIKFNAIHLTDETEHIGISSLLDRADGWEFDLREVEVPANRLDKFLRDNNLEGFDIVKIDAEGCSYQVLKSFGEYIKNIDYFQIEAEVSYHWKNQYMRDDVVKLMKDNNFRLIDEYGDSSQVELLFLNNRIE